MTHMPRPALATGFADTTAPKERTGYLICLVPVETPGLKEGVVQVFTQNITHVARNLMERWPSWIFPLYDMNEWKPLSPGYSWDRHPQNMRTYLHVEVAHIETMPTRKGELAATAGELAKIIGAEETITTGDVAFFPVPEPELRLAVVKDDAWRKAAEIVTNSLRSLKVGFAKSISFNTDASGRPPFMALWRGGNDWQHQGMLDGVRKIAAEGGITNSPARFKIALARMSSDGRIAEVATDIASTYKMLGVNMPAPQG